jgi:hypothetical protein
MDIGVVSSAKVAGNGAHPQQMWSQSQSHKALEIGLKYRWIRIKVRVVKTTRGFIDNPRVFDPVIVTLVGILIFGAYVTAYAYVIQPLSVSHPSDTIGQATVLAARRAGPTRTRQRGRPWNQALPDGYVGSLAAALIFGGAWIVDTAYWTPALGPKALGLDVLFTPPRLIEIAAVAVMASGPLRAAARRGDAQAGIVALVSASLLLSVLTFGTQFIHPFIDPWAWSGDEFLKTVQKVGLDWLGKNLGVAAILAQALILAGTGLLLNSGFRLRPGSLTLVFTLNGALVTITKLHFEFIPVAVVTGVAADAWIAWSARRAGRPSASLCAVIGGAFAASYMVEVASLDTVWAPSLWSGTILATVMVCWLMGRLLRAGLPAAIVGPLLPAQSVPVEVHTEARWPRDPASTVRPQLVRAALDDLGTPEALGRSPLGMIPGISKGGSAAADLRAVLVDVISELAASSQPRDAEAGRLLLDYYVKKVGSHEVIMERLHLSRPTFYRRLQRGFLLVAERLDEMSEFASRVPIAP